MCDSVFYLWLYLSTAKFVVLKCSNLCIVGFEMFMFIMFDSQEKLVEKNYYLHQSARDAYRSYLLAYNSHAMKDIFNVHRLDLQVYSF